MYTTNTRQAFDEKVRRGIFRPVMRHLPDHVQEDRLQDALGLTYSMFCRYTRRGQVLAALADHLEAAPVEATGRPDEWLDARSCSPVSRRRVLDLVARGDLPGSRVGRKVVVRRSDLDAYLLKHRVEPANQDVGSDAWLQARLAARGMTLMSRKR